LVLDLRTADVGGAVGSGSLAQAGTPDRLLAPQELQALPADTMARRVVVVLHGFNVDRRDGWTSLTEFMTLVAPSLGDALLIAVLWPGDSGVGFLSYSFEGRDADDSAYRLAQRIGDWTHPSARLSFVAHSKGCRVVMRCIQALMAMRAPQTIDQVCLMAAAMDRTCLTDATVRGFAGATRRTVRVAVLSSVNDKVLSFAYPLGDLLQGWLYAETEEPGLALGMRGPSFPTDFDVSARTRVFHRPTPRDSGVDHGDYLPDGPNPSVKERSAATFAAAALAGLADPEYA
jgi:hypothetical protein